MPKSLISSAQCGRWYEGDLCFIHLDCKSNHGPAGFHLTRNILSDIITTTLNYFSLNPGACVNSISLSFAPLSCKNWIVSTDHIQKLQEISLVLRIICFIMTPCCQVLPTAEENGFKYYSKIVPNITISIDLSPLSAPPHSTYPARFHSPSRTHYAIE
jgi:hypothetical protein